MTTDAVKWTADEERNARDWFQKLRRYLGSLEYDPASSQLRQTQHLASKYGTLLEHALDAERAAREQVEQKLAKISVATDFYSENDVRLSWAGGEVCMNCSHKLCQRVRNAEKAREQFAANADMLMEQGEAIARERDRLAARVTVLEQAYSKTAHEVEQTLGKVLGYPWFKDDQKNFPGATEANGVCVGEHVPESIAEHAARRITELAAQLAEANERASKHNHYAQLEYKERVRLAAQVTRLTKAAALRRNVIIHDSPQFEGLWVAVPKEDFNALRAALTPEPAPGKETT